MSTKYGRVLWSLMPRGVLWDYFSGKLDDLIEACAVDFQAVEDRLRDFLRETDPRRAVETLPDWEASVGLEAGETETVDQRQKAVEAKRKGLGVRPEDYLELMAPLLACAPEELEFIEYTSAGQLARNHPRDVYRGHIYRDPALPGAFDIAKAQRVLDEKTQGHIKLTIVERIGFRVGDPHSIVGRDLVDGPSLLSTTLGLRDETGEFVLDEDGAIVRLPSGVPIPREVA